MPYCASRAKAKHHSAAYIGSADIMRGNEGVGLSRAPLDARASSVRASGRLRSAVVGAGVGGRPYLFAYLQGALAVILARRIWLRYPSHRTCGTLRMAARRALTPMIVAGLTLALTVSLGGCGGQGAAGGNQTGDGGSTSGPAYAQPAAIEPATFDESASFSANGTLIDTSHTAQGYLAAAATNQSRLKLQVLCGEMSYNYDLPGDGTPIVAPLNMGNGNYTFRVMQNTSGNNYVEIAATTADVTLASEFEPYLRPNVFCSFNNDSACVELARSITAEAANEGDVMRAVYSWVVDNITYDYDKASEVANVTGYIPDPDTTLEDRTGICFDYASLSAAMLRSLGIPCKIITGYVSPEGVYHAWNLVYINGSWTSVEFSIEPDTWTRVDLTFAAAGAGDTVGDGTDYTDRYTY